MKTNSRLIFTLIIAVSLIITFISCEKDEKINMDGVYVLGTTSERYSYITLWHDGTEQKITNGQNYVEPTGLFVYNNDIYISGSESIDGHQTARVWKNGQLIDYAPDGDVASSIFVYNGDVYVVGHKVTFFSQYSSEHQYDILVWKNGIVIDTVISNNSVAIAHSMFVSDGNIYVTGHVPGQIGNMSVSVAKVWKNGVLLHTLIKENDHGLGNSIFVYNEDVYVAGYGSGYGGSHNYTTARLWKNEDMTYLSKPDNEGYANCVFVNDDNVYVAGYEEYDYPHYAAVYWENDQKVTLSQKDASASSIYVKDRIVYACGFEQENGQQFATIWIDGKSKRLSSAYSSTAKAIFVVDK